MDDPCLGTGHGAERLAIPGAFASGARIRVGGGDIQDLVLSGDHACLARGDGGVQVVNVSDPANVTWITGISEVVAGTASLTDRSMLLVGSSGRLQRLQLSRCLYPALPPPIVANGVVTLTWPTVEGVRLQHCTDLGVGDWADVPGSQNVREMQIPLKSATGFYRLIQP